MMQEAYEIPAIVCDADKLSQVAIIQELGKRGIPVTAVAGSPRATGFASKYVRQRLVSAVPAYHPGYIRFLVEKVAPGVVFYSNDANTENIATHRSDLEAAGFRVFVSNPSTLQRVIQKDELYRTALECGVAVPKCDSVTSAGELKAKLVEYGLPAILKSTNLAGGIYRFVSSKDAAAKVFDDMVQLLETAPLRHRAARLMLQQWIPQEDVTLWNFNASVRGGDIVSYSMGKRIRTDIRPDGSLGSILLFGRTEFHTGILEENRRLLKHLKFDGMVETEWSESARNRGQLYLYDFNPRPSGNIRWTFRSGVSIAEDCYRMALGLSPVPRVMQSGICYAKLIYRTNDILEAFGNPNLSLHAKCRVALEDIRLLALCRRHAVDILDPSDLGPTLRAGGELVRDLWLSLRRSTRHGAGSLAGWRSSTAKSIT